MSGILFVRLNFVDLIYFKEVVYGCCQHAKCLSFFPDLFFNQAGMRYVSRVNDDDGSGSSQLDMTFLPDDDGVLRWLVG